MSEKSRRRSRDDDRSPISRELPWSEEAEQHVIACCLLDRSDTLERAAAANVSAETFFSAANRLIWEVMVDVHAKTGAVTVESLAEELRTRRHLDTVGGFPYLMQITGRIPTTAHAGYFIDKVREKQVLRDFIKASTGAVEAAYGFTEGLDEFVSGQEAKLREIIEGARRVDRPKPRPLIDYRYPQEDDPDVLLGAEDYLGRGGIMLGISHAGAGKSSFVYDAALMWGLGKPWMGIRASQPRKDKPGLRILIIQSEDSVRYVGKIAESFVRAHKLTPQEAQRLRENVIIVELVGVTGLAFFAEVERLATLHEADLVVINPIYDYAEGDIAKAEFAKPFLDGLARANRFKKFAYVLIHHTGKPTPKDNKGKRAQVEDWESVYMGYGSSYFANKPRCSWLLEPRAGKSGRYALKLGKAGRNAGVVREVDDGYGAKRFEPVTSIPMRHSQGKIVVGGKERPLVLWEPDEWDSDENQPSAPKAAEPKPDPVKKPGRQSKFADEWIVCYYPASTEEPEGNAVTFKKALGGTQIPKSTFFDIRDRLYQRGWIEQVNLGPWRRTAEGDLWAKRWQNTKKADAHEEQSTMTLNAEAPAPSANNEETIAL